MNIQFKINKTVIVTERLILRGFEDKDLCDLYEHGSDKDVAYMAGWPPHESIEETKEILEYYINDDTRFAIILKDESKLIGTLCVRKYPMEEELTEFDGYIGRQIGFDLNRKYWGKGYVPEAAMGVIDHFFNELNWDFLICSHYNFNNQSRRVQEKCGFVPYRSYTMETISGESVPGTLNILINPRKNIRFEFSHPETLIYKE